MTSMPRRARQDGPIRDADWGRIVTIADPFGHGWCLLQFRGRGYDEIATTVHASTGTAE
jgi:lactoylglutathione lyase